ncbi:hypothetical protein QZH41_006986 [Actinostola sp. cb2023]|nr:hypothetical protein QZH41_006986 [Actinostola sp. cb2023]
MYLDMCKKTPDKRKLLGRANRHLGSVLLSLERYEEGLQYSTKALEIAVETDDEKGQACVYGDLGLYHQQKEDFDKAVEYHNKSLILSQKFNDKHGEGATYGNLGNAYQSQHEFEKALKCHKKLLEIAQEMGDKKLESSAYNGLGTVYKSQGEYSEALKCFEKKLEASKDTADKEGEAIACINLGIIYDILGKIPEAIDFNKKSLSLAKEIGNKYLECKSYHNLGTTYCNSYQLTESKKMLEKALDAGYKAVGSKGDEGDIYSHLGRICFARGDYDKAMEFYQRCLQICETINDPHSIITAIFGIGDIHLMREEFQQAIDYYEKGRKLAFDIKDKRMEADCHMKLAAAFRVWWYDCRLKNDEAGQEKYLLKSIEFLKNCLRCYEWMYDHIPGSDDDREFKISIFDETFMQYRFLTSQLLLRDEVTEALLVSERGRARALEDLLVTKYNINQDTTPRNDPISYTAVEQMASCSCIVFYAIQADSRFGLGWIGTWVVEPINPSVHTDGNQIINEATFTAIVESTFGLKVREVQCEDRLIHTVEHQEKPDEVDVSESSPSLPESIQQRCVLEEDLYDDDYARPLECLYKALISPVLHKLTKDEIVIIPDGPLFNVPFAALQDPDTGSFLSETKRIRLAPSLTSLKALQESPADFHSKAGALIIGNPQVGD